MSAAELLYRTAIDMQSTHLSIINAEPHPLLNQLCQEYSCTLQQHFKPICDALNRSGLNCSPTIEIDPASDHVLILPSKNRQQTQAWMATALAQLQTGGRITMACANKHGGKSYQAALGRITGNISATSKSKCRIFSSAKTAQLDSDLLHEWLQHGEVQQLPSHGLFTQPGLFSWDRPDHGSSILLAHLPELSGRGMDLCCGYGLLSTSILKKAGNIQRLHLVEADRFALDCAEKNCAPWQSKLNSHWLDAVGDTLPGDMEWIVCNPPFHTGQARDVGLGQSIVSQGCRALKQGGNIYLVANRKLPYEQLLRSRLHSCETLSERDGFKVIKGTK